MDYYQTLGVSRNASQEELKKAYKKASMQHHPDRGGDESKFKEINEAYSTLKDPQKRQAYDNPQPEGFRFSSSDMGGFEDLFAQFGFGGNPFRQQQRVNADITIAANISLQEAYNGKTLIANYKLRNGKEETVEIKIPPGALSGNRIRYQGFGEIVHNQRGDLYVQINVRPDNKFIIDGTSIVQKVNVNVFDLIIGGHTQVSTLDGGKIKLNIPPGTNSGTKFSVSGYGWPDIRSGRKGNMIVIVDGRIPKGLALDDVDAIRKIKKRLVKKGID